MIISPKNILIALRVLRRVDNSYLYFFDKLGLVKKPYLLRTNKSSIILRDNNIDRWVFTENMIEDDYGLRYLLDNNYSTIIDIGGNIGAFSLNASRLFPNAKMHIFEPDNANYSQLTENIEINHLQSRIKCYHLALTSSTSTKVRLYQHVDAANVTTIGVSDHFVMVPNKNFGILIKLIKNKTLVKIDIEGGEYEFFRNEYLNIIKMIDTIVIECHYVDEKRNINTITDFLTKNGTGYQIRGSIVVIHAEEKQ